MRKFGARLFFLSVFTVGCGSGPLQLHVPTLTPNAAREAVTPIDFEPIAASSNPESILIPEGAEPPGPAAVLASGIRGELQARAFQGGEAGGYVVKSRLDRFALRRDSDKGFGYALLYVDLSCEIKRKADSAPVWRGELRGRSAALGARQFFSDSHVMDQILADRLMSDVTRELASDLAVRILELSGKPSARVFADQDAEQQLAGVTDGPAGVAALTQNPEAAEKLADVAHSSVNDRVARAAAWNAIAMASGPDRPWIGGIDTGIDKDAFIRFFQYKALARHATIPTLRELKTARGKEENELLKEFLNDLDSTGGLGLIGFSRRRENLGL
jgi:hypothetical protein